MGAAAKLVLAALLILVGTPASATMFRPVTLAELVAHSDLILIGQCVEMRSAKLDRRIVTLVTIAVEETLKGPDADSISVTVPGGVDLSGKFAIADIVPGAPEILPGEELFLFLSYNGTAKGSYGVTGMSAGKFELFDTADGETVVAPNRMVIAEPPGDIGFSEMTAGADRPAPLSEFKQRVLDLLE